MYLSPNYCPSLAYDRNSDRDYRRSDRRDLDSSGYARRRHDSRSPHRSGYRNSYRPTYKPHGPPRRGEGRQPVNPSPSTQPMSGSSQTSLGTNAGTGEDNRSASTSLSSITTPAPFAAHHAQMKEVMELELKLNQQRLALRQMDSNTGWHPATNLVVPHVNLPEVTPAGTTTTTGAGKTLSVFTSPPTQVDSQIHHEVAGISTPCKPVPTLKGLASLKLLPPALRSSTKRSRHNDGSIRPIRLPKNKSWNKGKGKGKSNLPKAVLTARPPPETKNEGQGIPGVIVNSALTNGGRDSEDKEVPPADPCSQTDGPEDNKSKAGTFPGINAEPSKEGMSTTLGHPGNQGGSMDSEWYKFPPPPTPSPPSSPTKPVEDIINRWYFTTEGGWEQFNDFLLVSNVSTHFTKYPGQFLHNAPTQGTIQS